MQQMPSVNWTDNFVLNIMKSTTEIRNMKLHEENKHGSMQNYKAVRKLIGIPVLKLSRKWRNWKKFAVLDLRELENYERMIFPDANCGKASPQ